MWSTNVERLVFDSWGAYVEFCNQPGRPQARNSSTSYSASFSGTDSYEEAMKLALEGWHDGEAEARKISNALVRRVGAIVERDEELYDVEGYGVDISLYNQGIPECWMRNEQRYVEMPGPIVKVVYNMSTSAGVSTSVMIARGAATAGLVECIELSGRSVELWMTFNQSNQLHVRVKVKEAGQPLDMGRVMFAIAHPAAYRRLGFRVMERSEHCAITHSGYGMPCEFTEPADMGDLYVEMAHLSGTQWSDESSARAWVIQKLREQNVQVNDATTEVASV